MPNSPGGPYRSLIMMDSTKADDALLLLGRIFIAWIFIPSGLRKLMNIEGFGAHGLGGRRGGTHRRPGRAVGSARAVRRGADDPVHARRRPDRARLAIALFPLSR